MPKTCITKQNIKICICIYENMQNLLITYRTRYNELPIETLLCSLVSEVVVRANLDYEWAFVIGCQLDFHFNGLGIKCDTMIYWVNILYWVDIIYWVEYYLLSEISVFSENLYREIIISIVTILYWVKRLYWVNILYWVKIIY